MGRRLLLVIATLVAGVLPAAQAEAHAALSSSTPADGAVLAEAVASVSLTFTEPVQPTAEGYTVTLGDGGQLSSEATTADGAMWTLTFEPVYASAVTVGYDVISVDGHVISGALTFTVDAPAPTSPATSPATTQPPMPTTTATETTQLPTTHAAPTSTTVVAVAPPPSPTTTVVPDADDRGTSPVVWVLLAVGAAALLGVVVWSATRRRAP